MDFQTIPTHQLQCNSDFSDSRFLEALESNLVSLGFAVVKYYTLTHTFLNPQFPGKIDQ